MVIFGQQAKDFAARAEQQLTIAANNNAALQHSKDALGADLETAKQATEAAKQAAAAASCAGSVAIDTNGDGKVEVTDAIELFVATTMQGFGAETMLDHLRKKHPAAGAVTPIETVIANVKAAMTHDQQ